MLCCVLIDCLFVCFVVVVAVVVQCHLLKMIVLIVALKIFFFSVFSVGWQERPDLSSMGIGPPPPKPVLSKLDNKLIVFFVFCCFAHVFEKKN